MIVLEPIENKKGCFSQKGQVNWLYRPIPLLIAGQKHNILSLQRNCLPRVIQKLREQISGEAYIQTETEKAMIMPLEQHYIDSILSCLSEGVIIIDASDRILKWNTALIDMLHIDPSSLLGKLYQEVFIIYPQLGIISVINSIRTLNPPGTVTRATVKGNIPERGEVNLNLCIHLLANSSLSYIGMVIIIDDRAETERSRKQRWPLLSM
jgi:PAS domain-containing protein